MPPDTQHSMSGMSRNKYCVYPYAIIPKIFFCISRRRYLPPRGAKDASQGAGICSAATCGKFKPMRQDQIAAAIRHDLLRDDDDKSIDAIKCVSCKRGMIPRNGNRFCSERCRLWYDAGNPGHAQDWRQPKPSFRVAGWKVIAASRGEGVEQIPS
jgi:hypothetical protein